MGSSYFYLEFLITWLSILGESGFENPAIFALEYTLVPDRAFPTQLQEAIAGYNHVLSMVGDASKICVSGDSAGATVMLSLLLHLANLDYDSHKMDRTGAWRLAQPGLAVFISPWVTLISQNHQNTASDYLDEGNLHRYAYEYVGKEANAEDPLVSPGSCRDVMWWKKACPRRGMCFVFGGLELFAPEIKEMVEFLQENKVNVRQREEPGGIHAWPVASVFLSHSIEDRQKGLRSITQEIRDNL
jgi:acetyl esterase/lipase